MKKITLVAMAAGIAMPVAAQDPSMTARAFGARQSIQQISLSPDGTHVAIVSPTAGRGTLLLIADPVKGGAPRPILQTSGDPDRLSNCDWATNTRLICRIYMIQKSVGTTLGVTRMVAVNSDGSALKLLSAQTTERSLGNTQYGGAVIDWLGDGSGDVLMTRSYIPEITINTRLASSAQGLGVERVNPVSLSRRPVEPAKPNAVEYLSDGHGAVRVLGTQPMVANRYNGNQIDYFYRKVGSEAWLPLGTLMLNENQSTGFNPYAIDRDLNVVYGFDQQNGRSALFKIALDGSLKRELVLASPNVDIDSLIRIGRQNRVVGASFATERRESSIFDPELHKLGIALGKALPKQPIVTFVDASADEKTLLLFAGSDTDPGTYYLYDKTTRALVEVLPARVGFSRIALGEMKPITYPAADGTMVPGYLTLPAGSNGKNLPAIVMPHGGPSARDEWGFDWWAQFFAARGYAVLQPNFRGSAGYGSDWYQKNGFKSWRIAVGDVNDAGRWLVKQGIASPDKLAIVGWSYGGYAALQSPALDPALFKAIVAVAPVTDLDLLRTEARDFTNYRQVDAFIGNGAHIREGSPARNAAGIRAPVLLFHGDMDRNVGIGESRLMADKLRDAGKPVELVEFKGLDHQLEDGTARTAMLEKSDAFLRKAMGM